ncbi:hypothetical protein RSAG8_00067, partial [Rhizoctonia solani AG-8 WAC10335]
MVTSAESGVVEMVKHAHIPMHDVTHMQVCSHRVYRDLSL